MRKFGPFVWLLVVTVGLAILFFPRVSKYMELRRMEEKLTKEIADLKGKIRELEREEYLIKNDVAHLERVMREELRLVKPGEIVYKIVPEEEKVNPQTETKPASEPKTS